MRFYTGIGYVGIVLPILLLTGCSSNNPSSPKSRIPTSPAFLTAEALSPTSIRLAWEDRSTDELGFIIEKQLPDSAVFQSVDSVETDVAVFTVSGLMPLTAYRFRVKAYNEFGASEPSSEAEATTPRLPPGTPTNVRARAASQVRINVSWQFSGPSGDSCDIERRLGADTSWAVITRLPGLTLSYPDTNLTPSTTYRYRMRGWSDSLFSGYSNEASATTPSLEAPSNLSAHVMGRTRIELTWDYAVVANEMIEVERRLFSDTSWLVIETQPARISDFIDSGLLPSTNYRYRIRASLRGAYSEYSNSTGATTAAFAAPDQFRAYLLNQGEILLNWRDNTADEDGFLIERKTEFGDNWVEVARTEPSAVSFLDRALAGNQGYYYRVRAYSAGDYSAPATIAKQFIPEWKGVYGGADMEHFSSLAAIDGGLAAAGATASSGAGNDDGWLFKVNLNGSMIWSHTYGNRMYDYMYDILQLPDGDVLAVGQLSPSANPGWSGLAVRLTPAGQEVWRRTIGEPEDELWLTRAVSTPEGGFAVSGSGGGTPGYAFFAKLDHDGRPIQSGRFGSLIYDDYFSGLAETPDGGFLLTGCSYTQEHTLADSWLMKISASGDSLWSRSFIGGGEEVYLSGIRPAAIGGYILLASVGTKGMLIKINADGGELWRRSYGELPWQTFSDVCETPEGGFIGVGYATPVEGIDDDGWIVKLDASGNMQADLRIGGRNDDYFYGVAATDDGIFIGGNTSSFGEGNYDAWILKLTLP